MKRKYTPPSQATWNAGRKKANVTKAITLLNRIQVDAMGRKENASLDASLTVAIEELKEYKQRLLTL